MNMNDALKETCNKVMKNRADKKTIMEHARAKIRNEGLNKDLYYGLKKQDSAKDFYKGLFKVYMDKLKIGIQNEYDKNIP